MPKDGWRAGYEQGYDDGRESILEAHTEAEEAGYDKGYKDGLSDAADTLGTNEQVLTSKIESQGARIKELEETLKDIGAVARETGTK